ncbi:MAG: hypothetical protein V2I48_09465 [Xanthomonadales bacterium]|jgi:hypothetical protein|nr:hypothetical protein [Xanthomonadales bacterium]
MSPQRYRYLASLLFCISPVVFGADYFISTQEDFDRYREATLAPGDQLLFERGKEFNGMFAPRAVGAPGQVITISAFGEGPKPVIHNGGVIHPHPTRAGETVSAAVLLFNAEYVELSELEVTNNNGGDQDDEPLMGIYVLAEDTGKYHEHIYIENNYVHHVNGGVEGKWRGGIHLHGYSPTTDSTATYNDVRIVGNLVERVGGVGIGTDVDDLVNAHDFAGDHRPNAITNLYVAGNRVDSSGRNCIIARDSDYAVYEYNTAANCGRHSHGNSIFNFRTLGLVFQYNEAYGNTGKPDDIDRGGFDIDYNSRDTLVQYNYSHGNHWFLSIMKRPVTNAIVRYNLSVNDLYGGYHYGFESATDLSNVQIYNNTHYYGKGSTPEIIGPLLHRTPMATTFSSNIFFAEDTGTMGLNAENGVDMVWDTNVYYNISPPASERNALASDPLFVDPGAEPYDLDMKTERHLLDGYQLCNGSPSIGAGTAAGDDGGLDFWGNPVLSKNIGAYGGEGVNCPKKSTAVNNPRFKMKQAFLESQQKHTRHQ